MALGRLAKGGPYDLIVVNILARPIRRMAGERLPRKYKCRGRPRDPRGPRKAVVGVQLS